jgi:hypothetical protein
MIGDKKRVDSYIKSVARDFRSIRFEETEIDVRLRIGNFFSSRPIDGDYDNAVKLLMEDFLTITTAYYIKQFWEL